MLTFARSVLPLFALTLISLPTIGHAETKLAGQLIVGNPCALEPISEEPKACIQRTLPIGGIVTITSKSGTRKRVRVNAQGIFATRLNPGEYSIKLTQASIFGNPIDSTDLRLSEHHLTVGEKSFRVSYGVAHKDYTPHTFVGPGM